MSASKTSPSGHDGTIAWDPGVSVKSAVGTVAPGATVSDATMAKRAAQHTQGLGDVREVIAAREAAPFQVSKAAADQFKTAFDKVFSKPEHEQFRQMVSTMADNIKDISPKGYEHGKRAFEEIGRTCMSKVYGAMEAGKQHPYLTEITRTYENLAGSLPELKQFIDKKQLAGNNLLSRLAPPAGETKKPDSSWSLGM